MKLDENPDKKLSKQYKLKFQQYETVNDCVILAMLSVMKLEYTKFHILYIRHTKRMILLYL